jgi:hypothetical protein
MKNNTTSNNNNASAQTGNAATEVKRGRGRPRTKEYVPPTYKPRVNQSAMLNLMDEAVTNGTADPNGFALADLRAFTKTLGFTKQYGEIIINSLVAKNFIRRNKKSRFEKSTGLKNRSRVS